jgi:hypothetical protein
MVFKTKKNSKKLMRQILFREELEDNYRWGDDKS